MKPVRLLLIFLGILLALGVMAGGLALTPSVQRWAVLRALRTQPGLKVEIATVAAGPSHVRLGDVQVEKSGLTVRLAQLEADYSLTSLLFSRRLAISQLTGRGLVVDASKLSRTKAEAAAVGAPAAAPGLLGQVELPVELLLGDCLIEGRALLPGASGGPPVAVEYKLTGGKLAPGEEGALVLAATAKDAATTLRAQVSLRATQTTQRTFSRIDLTTLVDAEGRGLSGETQLKLHAVLSREATGETYNVDLDTVQRGATANLLSVKAGLAHGGYTGTWAVKADQDQLTPFVLGRALPDFKLAGEGSFQFDPATTKAGLRGTLSADISRLEALEPAWRAFGAIKARAQFDLAEADGVATLNQLIVTVAGDRPVLELSAARAAEINFKERRIQVGGSAPGEALTLTLHGLPLAWVRPFVSAADISGGQITGQLAITGESDRLLLRAVQPLRIDQLNVVQQGALLLAKADLSGGFEAVLTKQELTATVNGFTLKTQAGDTLSASAKIALPVSPDPSIAIVATYTADLPALLQPWLPLGRIKAAGETDLTLTGSQIDLRRLQAGVTDATGQDLVRISALRPFMFDLSARRATASGASGPAELLRITLGRLPLSALPLTLPGSKLDGTVTQGDLVLAVDGEKIALRSPAPFKLVNVSLTEQGRPALTGLSIEARPVLELTGKSDAKVQTGDITIRTDAGAVLLTAKAEATHAPGAGIQGAATFSIEVPALATQPIFAGAQAVSTGRASGEVRAVLGPSNQLEARMTMNNLVAAGSGVTLPVANLSFRAVAQADGRISVQAPLLLDNAGQRSDLNFALELTPAGRGFNVTGGLTGEHVELADGLALLGIFSASAAGETKPVAATAPALAVPDRVPVWSRFTGRLGLDIKSVARGTEWSMTGLTGQVVIESSDITLQKLEAAFGEKGRLAAKALVSFTRGSQPYELNGDFSLTEFDAGKLFKALEPGKPATIEGIFTVNGTFTGAGETLGRMAERTRGNFELTSRTGVFRGLQRTTNKVSTTTKVVELGASVLGSILGSEKATRTAEKVAGAAYFADQLATALGEFNYDQLNVRLKRDESLNVTMEDISLVAPEIRLVGKGAVTFVEGKSLLEQPLNASLSIAARGKIEETLGKLRLLNGAKDDLGYSKARETITVGGTLTRPDPTAFFTRIATAKLGELLAPEN